MAKIIDESDEGFFVRMESGDVREFYWNEFDYSDPRVGDEVDIAEDEDGYVIVKLKAYSVAHGRQKKPEPKKNGRGSQIFVWSAFVGLIAVIVYGCVSHAVSSSNRNSTASSSQANNATVLETIPVDTVEATETSETDSEKSVSAMSTETPTEIGNDSTEAVAESAQDDVDPVVEELSQYIDSSVAEEAVRILKEDIGFSDISFDQQLGETTNFELTCDGNSVVVTASDQVYRIFTPYSGDVYYEDGQVKETAGQLADKTISASEYSAYYQMAEEIVRNNLKNPNSADFPSLLNSGAVAMSKNGNMIAVQSYVDAANSLGAIIRQDWTVEFIVTDIDNYLYEVQFVKIGDQSSGTWVDLSEASPVGTASEEVKTADAEMSASATASDDEKSAYEKGQEISDQVSEKLEDIDWEKNYEKAEEKGRWLAELLNGSL